MKRFHKYPPLVSYKFRVDTRLFVVDNTFVLLFRVDRECHVPIPGYKGPVLPGGRPGYAGIYRTQCQNSLWICIGMEAVRKGGGGGRCAGTQVVISQTVFSRNSVYRRACNHCTLRQKHWTVASFSPQPFSDVVLQVKIYRKKSQHHCSNTERGEQGSAFLRGCPGTFNWDCRGCRRTFSARGRGGTSALFAPPPRPAYAPVL